ncbi:LysR family transcriptional regulator [Qiania dongpingensis]|uniref:LysR family transcriptional regulator n=1 Tax=Qiania dongpingensis TaxID=2763669 RepID=A0A7G9G6U0_9FIRM|nr:LysR family transcriptional regulator [Qiania dongpingensis]QNM06522.1 LysR family transcriptional regulator [Qiania dongpingensis]
MTLQQCRYLIAVAKYHSITKAADELFVTQPSISKAIHELESDLKITVFERSNRGVTFTKEGLELLSYAKMLVEQEENIRYHFDPNKGSRILNLSVSSQHFNFAAEAAAQMIRYLEGQKYEFSFLEGKASDVIEHVAAGVSALGVLSVSSLSRELLERNFMEQSLAFTAMATLTAHVFLGRHHPLASSTLIRPEELSGYPCLTYRKNDTPMSFTEDDFNIRKTSQLVFVQDRGTMDDLLVHTDGYNLGTGCVRDGFLNPEITAVPLDVPWQIHVGYLKKYDRVLSKEMMRFLDLLSESMRNSLPRV